MCHFDPVESIFTFTLLLFQIIANYLIILRVAKGTAFDIQSLNSIPTLLQTDNRLIFRAISDAMESTDEAAFRSDTMTLESVESVVHAKERTHAT